MEIRAYDKSDLESLVKLFYDTVHKINIRDYSRQQVDEWATSTVDMEAWHKSLSSRCSFIAMHNSEIIGFGDIDKTGFLDRLYVHHKYQRQGIASALCDKLEASVNAGTIVVHASITAKPFFEKRGYLTTSENHVIRNGICLTNYTMKLKRTKQP